MRTPEASAIVQNFRTVLAATLLILVSGAFESPVQRAAVSAAANPIVIGPIPATAAPGDPSHDHPFFSTTVDLASRGYVEEEFFFEGSAARYDIPAPLTLVNTPMTTANVIATGLPYRTRMVVRRPADARAFNGTVLMEWQNVATGYDFDALWLVAFEHITRRGYAWIGVSAQQAGVHHPTTGLRAWNPTRYGSLDLTANGTLTDDSLQYDVFSQAANAVRNPGGTDPMAGLRVERIIATGASLSAMRLVAHHNAVHPLEGVFDGYMAFLQGARLRPDLDVKVFKLLSETEVSNQLPYRQADSDTFRRWEVAGTSHVDLHLVQRVIPLQTRDLGGPQQPTNCTLPPYSRIPLAFVAYAVVDHMVAWVKHGIAPPRAPDIETADTTGMIVRDGFGNALGGIRLSQHAVPTATNTGLNGPATNFCRTFGSHEPFDQATLDTLYPSHGTYVSQVVQVTHENLARGYILLEEAIATRGAAAHAEIGGRD
jgi:hypothetical protein